MNRKLGKNILIVLVANIINIFFQVLTSFLLPKHLSVDCYAGIKTYTLYLSYVGLFHFGFIDGMYIKYGGEEWNTINRKDLLVNLRTLRNFEFFVSIICITASLIVKNSILLCFSLSLVPLNMSSYFKQLYQATGEFQYYGKIMNYSTGGIFICNMILLFIIRVDNEMAYILGNVFIYTMIWILLECRFLKKVKIKTGIFFSMKELLYNIKTGILLTLGNLSTTILTSMDRWFVKELLNVVAFAQYSFAVSMENFMNVAVTPIAVTLYNFFCKNTKKEEIRQVKNVVMIFAALLVSSAFPANLVLSTYLTEYIESAKVLFLLFLRRFLTLL